MLSFINMMQTNGQDTTHLSVQPSGQYLFAASYTGGKFSGLSDQRRRFIQNFDKEEMR
jgi:6-phosphogluconolactonase (cycloisomerase 2 family)